VLRGRDSELDVVVDRLNVGRAVALVGEAGIGKTSLLRSAASSTGRPVYEGGAFATLSWMPYLPISRAIGRQIAEGDCGWVAREVAEVVGAGVLLLDDCHWADQDTRRLVPLLTGRLRILIAVRLRDPAAPHVLSELAEIAVDVLPLGPLPDDAAAALAREADPGLAGQRLERVVQQAGGNPLLIQELAATGKPSVSLQMAVAAQMRQLTGPVRDAFAVLAAVGHPLAATRLGEAAQLLAAAGLVRIKDGKCEFRHPLLGESLLSGLDAREAVAAHLRAVDLVDDPGERARHLWRAGRLAEARDQALAAAGTVTRPGDRAAHLELAAVCSTGSDADALRLQAAHALAGANSEAAAERLLLPIDDGSAATRSQVMLLRSQTRLVQGDGAGAQSALDEAVASTCEARDWNNAAVATRDYGSGPFGETGFVPYTRADVRAQIRLRIAQVRLTMWVLGEYERAVDLATHTLCMALEHGVEVPAGHYILGTALVSAGRPGYRELLQRAMDLARQDHDHDIEMRAAYNLAGGLNQDGDRVSACRLAGDMASRAAGLGLRYWERSFAAAEALFHVLDARYAEALERADHLLDLELEPYDRHQLWETRASALMHMGLLQDARNQVDQALAEAVPGGERDANLRCLASELDLWSGRPREADRGVHDLLTRPRSADDWYEPFALLTQARALAERRLLPNPMPSTPPIPVYQAIPIEVEAHRLRIGGAPRAAAEAFDCAADAWETHNLREALYCTWRAGEELRVAGETALATARFELVEAEAIQRDISWLLAQVQRSIRMTGQRRSAPRTAPGPFGLSARQSEITAMICRGLTDREIAGQLGLASRTVETQVANALARLGARSRAQAVDLFSSHSPQADRSPLRAGQRRQASARTSWTRPAALRRQERAPSAAGHLSSSERPLVVVESDSGRYKSARADLERGGWRVVEEFPPPEMASDVRSLRGVVCAGTVTTSQEAAAALLAAIGGAGLLVAANAERDIIDRLCEDLRRLGPVQHMTEVFAAPHRSALTDEQQALLRLLAQGLNLGEAAKRLAISRRTADRRLAAARRHFGVATTAAALHAASRDHIW